MRTLGTRAAFACGVMTVALAAVTIGARLSWADPITVTFTAYPAAGDPVNTGPSTGTFTIDSSLVPGGAALITDPAGLATSVSFSWGSTVFDVTTADVIELRFNESGALEFWLLGGRTLGLAGWRDQPAELVVDDFVIAPGGGGRSFWYTLRGIEGTFRGTVGTAEAPAPVPEPSTWLLIGSGALALLRRRRSAASAPLG